MKAKKLFASILSAAIAFASLGMTAFAESNVATVSGTNYESLEDAVSAAVSQSSSSVTVTLNADSKGNGIVIPSGKNIVIDLNNHTYTIDGKLVGSDGSKSSGMQILEDSNVTIKNGTIAAGDTGYWDSVSGGVKRQGNYPIAILIMNYADLTLENVTLDGSKCCYKTPYWPVTLSCVNGKVEIKNSVIKAGKNMDGGDGYAFDVDLDRGYPTVSVALENSAADGLVKIWNDENKDGKLTIGTNTYSKTGDYAIIADESGKVTELYSVSWTYGTDSGFYMDSETKYGMMRFLFKADVEGTIQEVGIKYINSSDIGEKVANVTKSGNVNAFYGDIYGVDADNTGTYYAAAYVKTEKGTVWSTPVSCKVNWQKQFTEYIAGGNN